ncbi:MAG: 3-deoxy-7-phosphoheptulonate synthase [Firmicutes bacterium]|nr:3-deoxy-7-phosphoheptulonate synthase [Bacillota bacterium]
MIIQLTDRFSLGPVLEHLDRLGLQAQVVEWKGEPVVVVPGGERHQDAIRGTRGVASIHAVKEPFQLASRRWQNTTTKVRVGDVVIGGFRPVVIAGPCSVESREQVLAAARHLAHLGVDLLRGGAYKPRTSPYSFQGLGPPGLKLLAEARRETGLPIVTEVMEPGLVDEVAAYADMLQVGARNMQNFPLLKAVGRSGKPVLLKRGPWSSLETWLLAAEYVLAEGNHQVVLCERGIASLDPQADRVLDLTVVPRVQLASHLPILVDPSHGTQDRRLVGAMAKAAIAGGAHGVMVEVHPNPSEALSDAKQALSPADFEALMAELRPLLALNTNPEAEAVPNPQYRLQNHARGGGDDANH